MLQVQHVHKQYAAGDMVQTALDDVSLNLREHELVAILGPSGSGKSTLLNVIGGLDQYDSGDLIIDGISTKKYKDRDWDSYRNHTVGFIFQSYNLIPHQSVLANVELALTISGASRLEKRKKSIDALEAVGLGSQIHKKPNQMSGGQMQRVAIARALVNNPRIVLADEPTGALDSATSIQVMELLKKVSEDRLVVMVTHNPELAEAYADRIVRVKDGKIIGDSNPFEPEVTDAKIPQHKNMGKSSMSFFSALALSFNNLRSKKARTLMTAFAGSIGIIGIAVILALSNGFQKYVDQVQDEMLANNPLVLQSDTADLTSLMMPQTDQTTDETAGTTVTEVPALTSVFEHIGSNNLGRFDSYLRAHESEISHTYTAVQYDYGARPRIYSANTTQPRQINPGCIFRDLTGDPVASALLDSDVFYEMLGNRELLEPEYDLLQGRWPDDYHELLFVLPSAHQLSDQIAYTVGLKDLSSLDNMIDQLLDGEEVVVTEDPLQWDYDILAEQKFKLISVPDLYQYNDQYEIWEDMSGDSHYLSEVVVNGEELQIVGVVCPKQDCKAALLPPGIAYLPELTRHIIEENSKAEIIQQQVASPDIDVFTGKAFKSKEETVDLTLEDLITVDESAISSAFGMDMNEENLSALLQTRLDEMIASTNVDTTRAQRDFTDNLYDMCVEMLELCAYDHMDENGSLKLQLLEAESIADDYLNSYQAAKYIDSLAYEYEVSASSLYAVYKPLMTGFLTDYISRNLNTDNLFPERSDFEDPSEPEFRFDEAPQSDYTDQDDFLWEETESGMVPQENLQDELLSEDYAAKPLSYSGGWYEEDELDPFFSQPDWQPDPWEIYAIMDPADIEAAAWEFIGSPIVTGAAAVMSKKMMQATIMEELIEEATGLGNEFAQMLRDSFYINTDQLSNAFQFNVNEDELKRLVETISTQNQDRSSETNLKALGYGNLEQPVSISYYLSDFQSKEAFIAFIDAYNDQAIAEGQDENVIRYTDMSGTMMASVRTMIDSISYVLIAFVAISLIVSSIMIGIITYISVMERTKEIGVLRALGASKRNISQVFNAETFIIGLCSGLIGIGITLLLLIPGNHLLHQLIGGSEISASLPLMSGIILIGLSMILTLFGGLVPSRQASKKDPVIALRSE